MRTAVRDTSLEAFFSGYPDLQEMEVLVLSVFGPDTRLSRQQISEVARLPINTVCGRVNSLMTKGALVEEGERRDPVTRKKQALLRLPVGDQGELFQ